MMIQTSFLFRQTIEQECKPDRRHRSIWQQLVKAEKQKHESTLFLQGVDDVVFDQLVSAAQRIRQQYRRIVVFGAGASVSCGHLYSGLLYPQTNGMSGSKDGVMFHLCESLDADVLSAVVGDGHDSCFVFISRSGDTLETCEHLRFCRQRCGDKLPLLLFLGDSTNGILARWAQENHLAVLFFDARLSGRFSPLASVGMMIGLLAGADMAQARQAAQAAWHAYRQEPERILDAVCWHDAWATQKRRLSIFMTYDDALCGIAQWYRQLWAESLGKQGLGLTPLIAFGPADQHSQLQLWLAGPQDKTFTLLGRHADKATGRTAIASAVCRLATQESLRQKQLPLRIIDYHQVDESLLATLAVQLMLETYILCQLWQVNAFDQPAVVEGKGMARRLFSQRVS